MTIIHPTIDHIYQIDCIPHFMWSYYPLRNRKSALPAKGKFWILDSGGFSFLRLQGKYPMNEKQYLEHAHLLNPNLTVSMDWMCEPDIIKRTGLSIKEHIEKTVSSYWTILNIIDTHPGNIIESASSFNNIPGVLGVIQGWSIEDYLSCIDLLRDHDLIQPYMGVGTLCRRHSEKQILHILRAIKRELPNVQLHGFGVKTSILKYPEARELLYSIDSAAWGHYCYHLSGRQAKAPILSRWYKDIQKLANSDQKQSKLFP